MQQHFSGDTGIENELDVRDLFRCLWAGKLWIAGMAALFALLALVYTFFATQQWSATAITDKPSVSTLGDYYAQQQFLNNLEGKISAIPVALPSVIDIAYKEFIVQLSAWDSRRDFWLQTDYYKRRKVGNSKADAALLDKLIDQIKFTAADNSRNPNDSVKLTAETAQDANNLLRQYVAFASQRASLHLTDALKGDWQVRTTQIQRQAQHQEMAAQKVYQRKLQSVQQALKVARKYKIERNSTDTPPAELPDSELFMLGRPMLQARLESLQANGPEYDIGYDQNKVMLATLQAGPVASPPFQTYRYLRTPEEPVKRDSPRRNFLLLMWGVVGGLAGAGVALVRRTSTTNKV